MRAILLVLLVAALPAGAQERVLDFHSHIRIAADGGLLVTERIEVQVEGRDIKRGILRDFPTAYRDRAGARVKVPFDVVAVSRNGATEVRSLQALANGVRIRIGNSNVMLPRGRHVYEITYRTSRQLGFFRDHDELYWNVNGNGWTFPMDRVSAEVRLPRAVPAAQLRVEAYTGYQGERGRNAETKTQDGGAYFETTRPLLAQQGLTIVLEFPKGVVQAPSFLDRLSWWIGDNPGPLAGAGGCLLLLLFLWWRWTLVGRDPRAGPSFPRYEAPAGMGPAGVRYVDRMSFDDRCFAAGLLGLGASGFLRIRQDGESYTLERAGSEPAWRDGERSLASLVPAPGGSVTLGRTHNPAVTIVRGMLERDLAAAYDGKLFSRNLGSWAIGVLIAIASVVAMMMLEAPLAPLFALGALMFVLLLLFRRWLPAYSVQGRKLQDAIQGLRQYLSVAEKDDLARMKAPPQTPAEYARFLPYAVALDVEEAWTGRFTTLLGASAVAAAVGGYYASSSSASSFSGGGLSSSLGGLSDTVSASATPPGSSSGGSGGGGGGGGGSSGGGGGGGGGSGW